MKIIRTEKDLGTLKFGEAFEVEIPSFEKFAEDPDGPIKLVESKEWAEVQRLTTLAETMFTKSDTDDASTGLDVEVTDTHLIVTSTAETGTTEIVLGGDVRDTTVKLKAGQTTKRKLTDEGNGWVSVNERRYELRETN